jgi:Phosphomannomutase
MVIALQHLCSQEKTVSQVVSTYPKYTLIRDKFQVETKDQIATVLETIQAKYQDKKQNTEDGVKVYLNDAWIHIRPSNTEPIVRIFIEAPSKEAATTLMSEVKASCSV